MKSGDMEETCGIVVRYFQWQRLLNQVAYINHNLREVGSRYQAQQTLSGSSTSVIHNFSVHALVDVADHPWYSWTHLYCVYLCELIRVTAP